MAEPFLSEIRIMSFGFAPRGWALCDGRTLPINQNQPLFSLLGTAFGGDGRVNFGLPDLRSRVPIHVGAGHALGGRGGETAHPLTLPEIPKHTHALNATSNPGNELIPVNSLLAKNNLPAYGQPANLLPMGGLSVSLTGESKAHPNMQPFLPLTFCIALVGIFPSRN
jgi:microcystin-dependent protein